MKKAALIIVALVWISTLIILIISLTDVYPKNIFSEYRLIVGLAFITITAVLKPMYNATVTKGLRF
ncbi:hypothetical protein JBL43_16610 [Aureibaculum sp. A20]|uniref:Uncharacterized protein n=1 Tax=Aureibaculum flavum TaxID=2795986 RepID=A0ABS0WVK6_9FLAO|nr:hypothetical protein [Aureibaculum flavum]MBJ2175878.1 hypothetical protein [Aureibaculum flavum]